MTRVQISALAALLALAACSKPLPPQQARANAATEAACRSRADEIYLKQNRAQLSERDQRLDPYSANGLTGNTTAGLPELYGRDQNYLDCLRQMGPASAGGPGIDSGTGMGPGMSPGTMTPDGSTSTP
ncbi:MAG TPA: hypothetical protein VME92_17195 [Acetobacteraceae bacterium]|nr:hypothetical protein [Acetobacteraceae bacterium]